MDFFPVISVYKLFLADNFFGELFATYFKRVKIRGGALEKRRYATVHVWIHVELRMTGTDMSSHGHPIYGHSSLDIFILIPRDCIKKMSTSPFYVICIHGATFFYSVAS
jgi:hypothetical protein